MKKEIKKVLNKIQKSKLVKSDLVLDQERFISKLKEAAALRYEKLQQYGLCYDSFGVTGISMRLKDKASRLINFYEARMHNKDIEASFMKSDEGVKDTLLDIINYSVMGLMILDSEFEKLKNRKRETIIPFRKLWK